MQKVVTQADQTQKTEITLEKIYYEVKGMRDDLELVRNMLINLIDSTISEVEISDEEMKELDRLEKEPGRRLEDIIDELGLDVT